MSLPRKLPSPRILVIDDNPSIHDDIRKILKPEVAPNPALAETKALLFGDDEAVSPIVGFDLDSAFQGEEGIQMVHAAAAGGRPYALAFVDVRMPPGLDGIETVTRIWQDHPELQVVICTAYSDYSWEDMVRQLGRSSSMVVLKKPFDNIEVLQLAHALTEKWRLGIEVRAHITALDSRVEERTAELSKANDSLRREIAERLVVEQELLYSEERFSKAFSANPIPMLIRSIANGRITNCNRGFLDLTGLTIDETSGQTPNQLGVWADPALSELINSRTVPGETIRNHACQVRHKSGEMRDVILSTETIDLSGQTHLLMILEDVTEQMQLERQLRHSQKLEAVGQLAAGIAHDFNNMLTVIQGNASLLLASDPDKADRPLLESILRSAQRSAKLVKQLLAFSHMQMMEVRTVDVGELLGSLSDMLARMLGERVEVKTEISPDVPLIAADGSMIEQALINLAVNARDAMPRGGQLTIAARVADVPASATRVNQDAQPGPCLCFFVTDTGEGIPPDVLPRIFDPFFTTKPVGKGTGLGLSTTYGIARQHEGWIEVQSEVGKGTTFTIYIPLKEAPVPVRSTGGVRKVPASADHATILVVEDEDAVRMCVVSILKLKGYEVLSATSGVEALSVWNAHRDEISLLFTDMVMPEGMTGLELANHLSAERPDLKVIYTSGYSSDIAGGISSFPEGHRFLAKPFQSGALVELVRSMFKVKPDSTGTKPAPRA